MAHYFMGFVEVAAGAGHLKRAVQAFRRAAARAADDPEPHYRLGLVLLEDERFEEACRVLRRARKLDSEHAGILIAHGRCVAVRGRLDAALEALQAAAAMRLTRAQIRQGRATAAWVAEASAPLTTKGRAVFERASNLLEKRLPGQAAQVLEGALDELGHEPALHRLLGVAHLQLGNNSMAAVSLGRAVRYNPRDGLAAAYIGVFYFKLERYSEAEKYLRRACRLAPFNLLAHQALGSVLLRSGRVQPAVAVLQKAVNLSGRKAATLKQWARALKKAGRLKEAVEAVEEALKRRKDSYSLWMLLGDVYLSLYGQTVGSDDAEGYFKQAKKAFKKALDLRPGDLKAKQRLQTITPEAQGGD
jgi:Flp pilus assembly protein TadD